MTDSHGDGKSGDCDAFPLLFKRLKELLVESLDCFLQYEAKEVYKRFYEGFKSMLETVDPLKELTAELAEAAPRYDYSAEVQGNGYRSLLSIVEHCIGAVTELVYYCQTHRDKFYFRTHHYCLEVEAYACLLQRTLQMLQYSSRMIEDSGSSGKLITETFSRDVMLEVEQVDRTCFYGRTLGFQVRPTDLYFLDDLRVILRGRVLMHQSFETAVFNTPLGNDWYATPHADQGCHFTTGQHAGVLEKISRSNLGDPNMGTVERRNSGTTENTPKH